jgi:hypothetical protein
MKKVVLVFDGINFSKGAFEFAKNMNEQEPVLITGVFLPQTQLANVWSYVGGESAASFIPLVESDEAEEIKNNIAEFENTCQRNGMDYRVHKNFFDFGLLELAKETRFADLLIIGSERFYTHSAAGEPNEYLKIVLHDSECPVVVVPEKFIFPENNVLAYDGSASSVYAIKQFTYLFPELSKNKTILVYSKNEDDKTIPEESFIEELAARHFGDLTVMKLHIHPEKYFADWLHEKKNAILVSGAFGRSLFTQAFRRSFIAEVVKDHQIPVFIAHK